MGNLPFERFNVDGPFVCSGVDMFGPFLVKEGRKKIK